VPRGIQAEEVITVPSPSKRRQQLDESCNEHVKGFQVVNIL
jgi:hypothetical protein